MKGFDHLEPGQKVLVLLSGNSRDRRRRMREIRRGGFVVQRTTSAMLLPQGAVTGAYVVYRPKRRDS